MSSWEALACGWWWAGVAQSCVLLFLQRRATGCWVGLAWAALNQAKTSRSHLGESSAYGRDLPLEAGKGQEEGGLLCTPLA